MARKTDHRPRRRVTSYAMKRPPVIPAALALLLAASCTGTVSDGGNQSPPGTNPSNATTPGSSPPGSGTGNNGGGGPSTGSGPPATSSCANDTIPRARTWRLTNTQFRNTAQAVFGFAGPASEQLPQDGQPDGFANQADRLSVPPLLASRYLAASDEIAASVVSRSGEFIKCPMAELATGSCLKDFLTSVGTRAWRRPLTPAELTKYTNLFGTIAKSNTPEVAFKSVVQALMLSPNFLFRTELGDGASGQGNVNVRLTDHELASAISYMVIDGPPDATLMQLADGGKLRDPATLAAQAKRLLTSSPQASKITASFFAQWLQFDGLATLTKDSDHFPTYTPELITDLVAENQAMVDGVLFDKAGDQSVKTLLTASFGYVNSRTAALYGVQASGTALVKTELPGTQRRGLLTQAGFISAASDAEDTNLPARGRIVREQALCAVVAPPPAAFTFDETKVTPDMTNREKFITHTTNPACAGCHALFDGIGYAMEQYDAIGRFRTMDKMKTIDTKGTLPLPSGTLQFANYLEFIDQITKLPETYQCVASQYAAYATGRAPGEISQCESDAITKAFTSGGYKLDALVAAIVTSPNFAVRRN
jgi:hypothetical protein